MKKTFLLLVVSTLVQVWAVAQVKRNKTNAALLEYFDNYTNEAYSNAIKTKVEDITFDMTNKHVGIYLSEPFLFQPFTPELVKQIYGQTQALLPAPYNTFSSTIYAQGTPIEQLVPAWMMEQRDTTRDYQNYEYTGSPWVKNVSRPNEIKHGLEGRHLCLWQSHGRYYNNNKRRWEWQRPNLFCTTEDMFTQSFVVPYLIPMLERAGAIVFTPRERDWQKNEIIVDNDNGSDFNYSPAGLYEETNVKHNWKQGDEGFAWRRPVYEDGDNPFADGTFRYAETYDGNRQPSTVRWQPNIIEEGDYAVYVSYKTLPNSVSDAQYTVVHEGIETQFRVNQQIGGGTWVYLGTFHFQSGKLNENCVKLTNYSKEPGVVTADAVRFGGGMGNVARRDSTMDVAYVSGLPRCLEAARYSALWYGFGRDIYNPRTDDYDDDIVVRPFAENYLSRGSFYQPGDSGLCVPIELSMGVHTDAGIREDNTFIGTLGIYTSGFYDGQTAAGLSRLTSRDFVESVMTQITSDMKTIIGAWNRRQIFDRNYGESREPQVPAMLLELLSHQNWADMHMGHDPYFKFLLSRAVYKGILRYIAYVHGEKNPVVQPLPVANPAVRLMNDGKYAVLTWQAVQDPIEQTAAPTHYIIYRAEGDKGFDNGTILPASQTQFAVEIQPNVMYRFAVEAANDGGSSGRCEEVCIYKSTNADAANLLIVDGFQRVAGPLAFDGETIGGFDFNADPGVADFRTMAYCGAQINFDKNNYGKSGEASFGFSTSEFEGKVLPGNTHNYSTLHARDLLATGVAMNICSCTSGALERLPLDAFQLMDIVMGAQKNDGYSLRQYKTFTPFTRDAIRRFTRQGGSVLLSGAFVGSDMQNAEERQFTNDILKYNAAGSISTDSIGCLKGMNIRGTLYGQPNEQNYWIRQTDVLAPASDAFCTMIYEQDGRPAAIAYQGSDYHTLVFGFPLECLTDVNVRRGIFAGALHFLLGS